MTNHLHKVQRAPSSAPRKMRPKGWTPERRARQARLIRLWQPWRRATGPRTAAGKARCAMNATRHGFSSRASTLQLHRVRHALRLAAHNIAILRALIRLRNAARFGRLLELRTLKTHLPLVGRSNRRSAQARGGSGGGHLDPLQVICDGVCPEPPA